MSRLTKSARPSLSANLLLSLVAAYLVVFANARFWSIALDAANGQGGRGIGVIAAIAAALFALTLLMLLPLGLRWVLKPSLVAVLLLSAFAAYFIGDYGAVIDRHALASVYETDTREASEWLTWRMFGTVLLLGGLPALLVCWPRIAWHPPLREMLSRLKLFAFAATLLIVAALSYGKDVASLLRNHMELRHIANPFALLAANLSYLDHLGDGDRPLQRIAIDAHRSAALVPTKRPVVLVLAIGESTRAQSIDLNGYVRDTDIDLHPVPLVNFAHVSSCGTNTATSLPCMFSNMGRKGYDDGDAKHRENVLDVLMRSGYDVLWLDNNTGSKGLAARGREVHLANGDDPALCSADGCYDQVLLDALADELPKIRRDTVIVVHLLGSHGPAYYARYPAKYAVFVPACHTVELQRCSDEELRNAYDNSVLYTTHILAGIVSQLGERAALVDRIAPEAHACLAKRARGDISRECPLQIPPKPISSGADAEKSFDAAMLFVSDHGESIGEHGLYLHGAPYAIAPEEQTHVPMFFWTSLDFAKRRKLDLGCMRANSGAKLSHDNFFHSVLGLASVETRDYRSALDVFGACSG
jgi:lipid A ethanolaminephosphotransferase